jgi:hypothetical protein
MNFDISCSLLFTSCPDATSLAAKQFGQTNFPQKPMLLNDWNIELWKLFDTYRCHLFLIYYCIIIDFLDITAHINIHGTWGRTSIEYDVWNIILQCILKAHYYVLCYWKANTDGSKVDALSSTCSRQFEFVFYRERHQCCWVSRLRWHIFGLSTWVALGFIAVRSVLCCTV